MGRNAKRKKGSIKFSKVVEAIEDALPLWEAASHEALVNYIPAIADYKGFQLLVAFAQGKAGKPAQKAGRAGLSLWLMSQKVAQGASDLRDIDPEWFRKQVLLFTGNGFVQMEIDLVAAERRRGLNETWNDSMGAIVQGAIDIMIKSLASLRKTPELTKRLQPLGAALDGVNAHLGTLCLRSGYEDDPSIHALFKGDRVSLVRCTNEDAEMMLTVKSEDGFWSIYPGDFRGLLPVRELKELKNWVGSYQGAPLKGTTGTETSAKLLRWLGMDVLALTPEQVFSRPWERDVILHPQSVAA